jgi:hypothetical protein
VEATRQQQQQQRQQQAELLDALRVDQQVPLSLRLHSSLEQLVTFLDGSPPSDMPILPNGRQLNPAQAAETCKISATPLVALDGSPLFIVTIEVGMFHPPTPRCMPAYVAPPPLLRLYPSNYHPGGTRRCRAHRQCRIWSHPPFSKARARLQCALARANSRSWRSRNVHRSPWLTETASRTRRL